MYSVLIFAHAYRKLTEKKNLDARHAKCGTRQNAHKRTYEKKN